MKPQKKEKIEIWGIKDGHSVIAPRIYQNKGIKTLIVANRRVVGMLTSESGDITLPSHHHIITVNRTSLGITSTARRKGRPAVTVSVVGDVIVRGDISRNVCLPLQIVNERWIRDIRERYLKPLGMKEKNRKKWSNAQICETLHSIIKELQAQIHLSKESDEIQYLLRCAHEVEKCANRTVHLRFKPGRPPKYLVPKKHQTQGRERTLSPAREAYEKKHSVSGAVRVHRRRKHTLGWYQKHRDELMKIETEKKERISRARMEASILQGTEYPVYDEFRNSHYCGDWVSYEDV